MLIHVARIDQGSYLLLKKEEEGAYVWHTFEGKTSCSGATLVAALQAARQTWTQDAFRTLHCGFRYTLPERDVVGVNALFWQMALSYEAPSGKYFDPEAGHLCYVDFASHEALTLWRNIRNQEMKNRQ